MLTKSQAHGSNDQLTGTRIIGTYRRWLPYVEVVRDQAQSPTFYLEFETLTAELEQRRATHDDAFVAEVE